MLKIVAVRKVMMEQEVKDDTTARTLTPTTLRVIKQTAALLFNVLRSGERAYFYRGVR